MINVEDLVTGELAGTTHHFTGLLGLVCQSAADVKRREPLFGQKLGYVHEAGEVEVLYALRQAHWGQGIATEAARASARFGFEYANLTSLIALAVPENIASRRVMEHLGFQYEKDAHYFGLDLVCTVLPRERFRLDDSFFLVR